MSRAPTLEEAFDATFDSRSVWRERGERRRAKLLGDGWSRRTVEDLTARVDNIRDFAFGLVGAYYEQLDPYSHGMDPHHTHNKPAGRRRKDPNSLARWAHRNQAADSY